MANPARVAVVGVVLTGLAGACSTSSHPPAPAGSQPAATRTSPVSPTTATTSTTTTVGFDGFVPVTPGSDLTRMVTSLGTVLRIDANLLQVALVPGTTEPGGTFPEGGEVPPAERGALVAATNAGFRRADARGGEMVDGRTVGALQPGAASLVIRADGSCDVGAWQDEVGPAAGDVAVLQNLQPLVDHGRAVGGLDVDILGHWGLTFRPALPVSVWRSGLGVDSRGRLLYAAGPNLVPAQLAALLLAGGAIRGMELDINHLWVFVASFAHPDPGVPETVQGQALLPGMVPSPDHVLVPGARDFLAVYQRRPPA